MLGLRDNARHFGAGYPTLNFLKRFPFDMIKINRICCRAVSR